MKVKTTLISHFQFKKIFLFSTLFYIGNDFFKAKTIGIYFKGWLLQKKLWRKSSRNWLRCSDFFHEIYVLCEENQDWLNSHGFKNMMKRKKKRQTAKAHDSNMKWKKVSILWVSFANKYFCKEAPEGLNYL